MSWLARSIAKSLRLDDEEQLEDANEPVCPSSSSAQEQKLQGFNEEEEEEENHGNDNQERGVKEDLSELKDTFTRRLRGVASFLAPPPPPPPPPPPLTHLSRLDPDLSVSNRNRFECPRQTRFDHVYDDGIEENSDFERFRGGNSYLPNYSDFEFDDRIGDAVGITEEVLAFARNIAHHPETWLDFPLSEEDDIVDFEMSDPQRQHAFVVEYLSPRLRALRIELCPAHMSEGYFWNVYFVLLYSRLNKHDAELLSTPQVVQARAMWMQELQKHTKPEIDSYTRFTFSSKDSIQFLHDDVDPFLPDDASAVNTSLRTRAFEPTSYHATTELEKKKDPIVSTEIQYVDKSVIKEEPLTKTRDKQYEASSSFKIPVPDYDDDCDDWLKESSELNGFGETSFFMGNEEDVSFSDLEDDDDCLIPIRSKIGSKDINTSTKTS